MRLQPKKPQNLKVMPLNLICEKYKKGVSAKETKKQAK
jgi:hypothetical protein